jgi:hypothetical protein
VFSILSRLWTAELRRRIIKIQWQFRRQCFGHKGYGGDPESDHEHDDLFVGSRGEALLGDNLPDNCGVIKNSIRIGIVVTLILVCGSDCFESSVVTTGTKKA